MVAVLPATSRVEESASGRRQAMLGTCDGPAATRALSGRHDVAQPVDHPRSLQQPGADRAADTASVRPGHGPRRRHAVTPCRWVIDRGGPAGLRPAARAARVQPGQDEVGAWRSRSSSRPAGCPRWRCSAAPPRRLLPPCWHRRCSAVSPPRSSSSSSPAGSASGRPAARGSRPPAPAGRSPSRPGSRGPARPMAPPRSSAAAPAGLSAGPPPRPPPRRAGAPTPGRCPSR